MSANRDKKSILLTGAFHSFGRASTSEGATTSYIKDSRSSTLGLSNEVSFDLEFYWEGG